MRPTFYGLETAKSGLYMSQKALDVTGHNIANAQTPGYTRQRLITSSIPPYNTMTRLKNPEVGRVGNGVEAQSLDQIRDQYLDRRIRNHSSLDAYWQQRDLGLADIEAIVNGEIGDNAASLNKLSNAFFQAFNYLCTDKASTDKELRTNLVNAARALTDGLHDVYMRFEELQQEYDLVLSLENGGLVSQVNNIIDGIVGYNRQIYAFEMNGESALDLRDQRNLLLDELSTLVDIEYYEDIDSKLHVSVGGREIIYHTDEDVLTHMVAVQDKYNPVTGKDDLHSVQWEDGTYINLSGGKIKAYLDLRDGVKAVPSMGIESRNGLAQYMEMLDDIARTIVQKINDLHVQAYSMPNEENGMTSTNGFYFFAPPCEMNPDGTYALDDDGNRIIIWDEWGDSPDYSKITAKNISLSRDIDPDQKGSIYNISISSQIIQTPPINNEDNESANNEIGLLIVGLGLKDNLTTGSVIGKLQTFLVTVGSDKKIASARSYEYQSISYELTQMWQSYSGVSNDEEMTDLIRFNHSYTAASRNITAIDEMLDILINRTGRVGL